MLPTIDTKSLPLVRITYPSVLSPEDVDEYAAQVGRLLSRARIATNVDIRQIDPTVPGVAGRKYLAEAVDRVTKAHPGRLIAEAIVMDSAVLRGLYTAFCWVRKDTSYVSKAFGDVVGAETWVHAQIESLR